MKHIKSPTKQIFLQLRKSYSAIISYSFEFEHIGYSS